MNIWIINQYTGTPTYGMNYRSYYLAKTLMGNGAKVTIFSGSYSHLFTSFPHTDGMFTYEKIDDVDFYWVKTPKYARSKSIGRVWNMLSFTFKLFFFRTKKLQKPDVIIISSLSLFPVINAYFWAKKFNAKLIFEVRDLWPQTLIELGNFSNSHPLIRFLGFFETFGYKKADYVVSLLPHAKAYMQTRGMLPEKFRYIPNGIELEEVNMPQKLNDQIRSQIPENRFIIGYVGTIGIANAMEYLIEAANLLKAHKEIHFVIVGKGGEKVNLQRKASEYNLHNITFIDPIPKSQVQSMLKHFDICYLGWHAKRIYQYGISANKLFDYMFSKKPILHSIDIENDPVTIAKCGMTVPAEDPKAIAEGIIILYRTEDSKLQTMGHNGKKYVLEHHTYKVLAKQYEELF